MGSEITSPTTGFASSEMTSNERKSSDRERSGRRNVEEGDEECKLAIIADDDQRPPQEGFEEGVTIR
jgi:hypothetical protein